MWPFKNKIPKVEAKVITKRVPVPKELIWKFCCRLDAKKDGSFKSRYRFYSLIKSIVWDKDNESDDVFSWSIAVEWIDATLPVIVLSRTE